jgi:hypothetical protein
MAQGLHTEPSFFASDSMDVVTIELRRRLWHQILYIDFRSAEAKGQEPTISDEKFTTRIPRNVDDSSLVAGDCNSPPSYDEDRFTDMTLHLVRLVGLHCVRKIIVSTSKLQTVSGDQKAAHELVAPDALNIPVLIADAEEAINSMTMAYDQLYGRYFDRSVPMHRLTFGLAKVLEWRCWVLFWTRIPKEHREKPLCSTIRIM